MPQHNRAANTARFFLSLVLIFFLMDAGASGPEDSFERIQISIGQRTLVVEVADSQAKRETGLMYRKQLGENEGMLFIYSDIQHRRFWMKNTYIPLSLGIFDASCRLVEIIHMTPAHTVMQKRFSVYTTHYPGRYFLEVNQGWFRKNKIDLGMTFSFITDNNGKYSGHSCK